MVYKIYVNGENIDAEFGCPVTIHEIFTGEYGEVLKKAENLLSLIDLGGVSVFEKHLTRLSNPIYVANKVMTETGIQVRRNELI